ncbi:MAG: glycosyltransferase [Candidatus Paceibacterota bacterium]|jgi:cellulose synthase/poly-beta-1,6-N-acetylglucosamine synthase-like glycosyltransferase
MEKNFPGLIYLSAFIVIWLIDGLKLLIESFCHGSQHNEYAGEHNKVTVIVAAHNEENTILNTINSLSHIIPLQNIIIVDDGSKDKTAELVRTRAPEILLILTTNNGKVKAINYALNHVKTPYVLLMDADTEFEPGFIIPTKALEDKHATAVSFNVVPTVTGKSFMNRFWLNFQSHEYAKSMQIGKRFSHPTKSIHCISGAAGLFRTERLKELAKKHTTIFPGEDLERTLLELSANGDVIFSENTVFTDVPQTFFQLCRQRIIGWWPGLWRNMWLFLKLIIKRKEPFRLRYELIYEIFALFTNPLKIISLVVMILKEEWYLMFFIFCNYLFLEIFVFFRIKKLNGKYMKMESLIIGSFALYSLLQMFCVVCAFFVFLHKKLFSKDWKKVVMIMVLLIPFFSQAQEKEKDWTIDYGYSHINDPGKDRSFENQQLYVGYKNFYIVHSTMPYNIVNIGGYFGSFIVDTRYQWQSNGIAVKVQYEHWFGNIVPHIIAGYGVSEQTPSVSNPSFPTIGLGINYYLESESSIGIDAIKEFGRVYGLTYIAKAKFVKKPVWGIFGVSITNSGHTGVFGQVGYEWFYVHTNYYQHFDFNIFDRKSVGIGLKFGF